MGQPETSLERLLPFVRGWQYAKMLPTGELLVVVSRGSLLKLDWNSQVVWEQSLAVHHDIDVGDDRRVYALTESFRLVGERRRLILDSVFKVLTPRGAMQASVSLYDVIQHDETLRRRVDGRLAEVYTRVDGKTLQEIVDPPGALRLPRAVRPSGVWTPDNLRAMQELMDTGEAVGLSFREAFTLGRMFPGAPFDIFHANTLAPVRAHPAGLWEDGDLLVSLRNFDVIGVISRRSQRMVWSWGPGVLKAQHQPSMLTGGNLLVFDNGMRRSRVVEVDPRTNEIVWEYWAPFERSSERFVIYRLTRLAADVVEPLLKRHSRPHANAAGG